jgi:phosphoglycolate phosphatase-like HAD superfamily hydrolase
VTTKPKISKLLLFDLDWTLIYTGGAGVRALNSAFKRQFGIAEAMKKISPDGKTDPAICREMIKVFMGREPQQVEIDKLCQGYLEYLAQEVPQGPGYRILPGIPELLSTLSSLDHYLMGLGTGNLEEGARIKLARADFMKYFRFGGYGSACITVRRSAHDPPDCLWRDLVGLRESCDRCSFVRRVLLSDTNDNFW